MTEKLTMAVIGFGKSATRYHLPYLMLRDNIQVKWVYARHLNKRPAEQEFYKQHHVQFTDNVTEVLSDPAVKLVTICLPPALHFAFAKRCLEAGKNVLVEKPFTSTVAEAKALFDLAAEHNLLVMPYQNRRFDGEFLALQQVLQVGYLGEPLELESHFDHFRPDPEVKQGAPEDGAFYGLGSHLVDQVVALFGRPQQVSYDIRAQQNPASTVDDYYDVSLFYPNFKATVKSSSLVAQPYPRFILHGTQGSFIKYGIDQQENDLKAGLTPAAAGFGEDSPKFFGELNYQNANGDWINKQLPTPRGDYGRVYDGLYESIIHGAAPLVSADEAITDLAILAAGFSQLSPSIYQLW
ncbi:oxidoreductase (plasmid) [Paucilactobacillus hokkaidonensis JCM 18461]|uniref:Oxidoreductase n=2 Tax=Paucilactobacillus hokkaidonensis TaxID=1193095 RepID=A0A0A1H0M3_9LACO|nr:oxidoreductase [Paucilactobacillus hokkaidonensis]KRO07370.1 dehydrogenase related protein [Paucilactobacillus hokkaidonensis]BAP86809.1 oxidoreductase [Paucilactobacillus hokkaidonensis JCM 18461]